MKTHCLTSSLEQSHFQLQNVPDSECCSRFQTLGRGRRNNGKEKRKNRRKKKRGKRKGEEGKWGKGRRRGGLGKERR